ncbi:MAG: exodeoxyribonuclease VII small subunit [Chloroflexi bacterium]|jgi:exodeoxyribonuclease VII small subunit|nr:exodeoxyribonuclease VII small subunit [Chloroflexota bacterium]
MTEAETRKEQEGTSVEGLTFEQAYKELEEIVASLENEEHPLEKALALFERGQTLARYCSSLLDQAELRIQQIVDGELVEFNLQS